MFSNISFDDQIAALKAEKHNLYLKYRSAKMDLKMMTEHFYDHTATIKRLRQDHELESEHLREKVRRLEYEKELLEMSVTEARRAVHDMSHTMDSLVPLPSVTRSCTPVKADSAETPSKDAEVDENATESESD